MGVRQINTSELNQLNIIYPRQSKINDISINATLPNLPPSNIVDILTYGEKTIYVNDKQYKIWIIYAIPKDGIDSPLKRHYSGIKMNDDKNSFMQELFYIYLQKAIGEVPYISWLPYELLLPTEKNYSTADTYTLNVSLASRIKYVYVYFSNTDSWELMASSNNVVTVETHIFQLTKNGIPYIINKGPIYNYFYPDQYDSIETIACSATSYVWYPVGQITYKNNKGNTKLSILPPFIAYPNLLY